MSACASRVVVDVVVFNNNIVCLVGPHKILPTNNVVLQDLYVVSRAPWACYAEDLSFSGHVYLAVLNQMIITLIKIERIKTTGAIYNDVSEREAVGLDLHASVNDRILQS